MKAKKYMPLIVLAAVVVVLGVALVLLNSLEEEEETGVPLFDFASSSVTALSYQDGETEVTLLQDEDWYLQQDEDLPLDQDTVTSLVEDFAALQAVRDLGAEADTTDMGLDEPTMVFTIGTDGADIASAETASGETATGESASGVYTVTIGAENSITGACYAKVSWNDHIYTIESASLSGLIKTPGDLYKAQDITDLEEDEIANLSLQTSGEVMNFTKEDGTWTMDEDPDYALDQDALDKMAATICTMETEMTITHPEADSVYGLDDPQAVVTVTGSDGTTITCSFGNVSDSNSEVCYVRSSHTAGVVYEVNADHLAAFAYTKETLQAATEETAEEEDSSDIIAENPVGGTDDYANSGSNS